MSRGCMNHLNSFYYICGEFTPKVQVRNITPLVHSTYGQYFGCKIGDQDKSWAPHFCCATCAVSLAKWMNGSRTSMPLAVPMFSREQKDHFNDCYFCITDITGFSSKNKKNIIYPNLQSAIRLVNHSVESEIPKPKSVRLDTYNIRVEDISNQNDEEFYHQH